LSEFTKRYDAKRFWTWNVWQSTIQWLSKLVVYTTALPLRQLAGLSVPAFAMLITA
jgi:hypothetical protein